MEGQGAGPGALEGLPGGEFAGRRVLRVAVDRVELGARPFGSRGPARLPYGGPLRGAEHEVGADLGAAVGEGRREDPDAGAGVCREAAQFSPAPAGAAGPRVVARPSAASRAKWLSAGAGAMLGPVRVE
ncbi:hypothetical protein [Streptomyces narbonensis]